VSEKQNQPIRTLTARFFTAVSPDHTLTAWLFLRALGFVYFCAFASLWPQIPGLLGQSGILPAGAFLGLVRGEFGANGYWLVPTLAWWSDSDSFLLGLCAAGMVLSVLLVLDVLPTPALVGLWVCWLSLVNVGQDFLSFQWDVLLLEAGFLAVFLVPGWHLRPRLPRQSTPPFRTVLWLLHWLLFRLMFFSGIVKLASGDPAWRSLSALRFHYETQPLPTPPAWYAHQLPAWFHSLETATVLLLELAVPFLSFVPGRPARLTAAGTLTGLQALILLTGNYAFFNLLSIALCGLLLTDDDLRRLFRARKRRLRAKSGNGVTAIAPARTSAIVLIPLTAMIALLSVVQVSSTVLPGVRLPEPLGLLAARAEPFHVFNRYGLFAVMTTRRLEIVIEGSRDGHTWKEYNFRYKPGDIRRGPRWVWPHQPRLDWQMWFAALSGPGERPSWFPVFLQRVLQETPEVLTLMGKNPFAGAPPRYVRAALYDYRFTSLAGRRATGAWWQRKLLGTYFPAVSLERFGGAKTQK
jgi:hypothetical protein